MTIGNTASDIKIAKRAAIGIVLAIAALLMGPLAWRAWIHSPRNLGKSIFVYDHDKLLTGKTRTDLNRKLASIKKEYSTYLSTAIFKTRESYDHLKSETDINAPAMTEVRLILILEGASFETIPGKGIQLPHAMEVAKEAKWSLETGDPDFALYRQTVETLKALGISTADSIMK